MSSLIEIAQVSSPGIDPTTFWLIVSAMGGAISTLAGIIYHGERERRKAAEAKLDEYEKLAPDVAEEVRRLTQAVRRSPLMPDDREHWPYPYSEHFDRRT